MPLLVFLFALCLSALFWPWSQGLAAAALMTGLALSGFAASMRRIPSDPPPVSDIVRARRRARRQARTAFWRQEILAAANEPGKRGELARSILKRWQEAESSETPERKSGSQ